MNLKELFESKMSELHLAWQEKLMQKFSFGDNQAEDVLDFALGDTDWEDLDDEAREKLYSHYQKTQPFGNNKEKTADPQAFIGAALKTDLGIK